MRSTQNEEGNIDTDAILRITRAPKTPPTYVPRSRSLDDLPGGLRVPILQKPQSRVAARLEALQDGLQELTILREQQKTLVNHHVKDRRFTDKGQSQVYHLYSYKAWNCPLYLRVEGGGEPFFLCSVITGIFFLMSQLMVILNSSRSNAVQLYTYWVTKHPPLCSIPYIKYSLICWSEGWGKRGKGERGGGG